MNAMAPIIASDTATESAFDRAECQIALWRGRYLEEFTRIEAAVTDTLLALAGMPLCGAKIACPHLVGQKLAALAEALDVSPAPTRSSSGAAATLASIRAHEDVRIFVCHGVATVMIDREGGWHALLRNRALRGGKPVDSVKLLSRDEAAASNAHLALHGKRLIEQLNVLREQLQGG